MKFRGNRVLVGTVLMVAFVGILLVLGSFSELESKTVESGSVKVPDAEEILENFEASVAPDLVDVNESVINLLNAKIEEEAAQGNLRVSVSDRFSQNSASKDQDGKANVSGNEQLLVSASQSIETEDISKKNFNTGKKKIEEISVTKPLFGNDSEAEEESSQTEEKLPEETVEEDRQTGMLLNFEQEAERRKAEMPVQVKKTPYEEQFSDKVIPNPDLMTEEFINVRKEADGNSEIIGKMYKGSWALLTESKDGWLHIASGAVDGWVSASLCCVGRDAGVLAFRQHYGYRKVTVTGAERLNIHSEPGEEAPVIGQVTKGEVFRADDVEDGWVRFTRNGRTGYVSEEYVKVRYMLDLAMTNAQEKAWKEEQARIARNNSVINTIDAHAAKGGTNRGKTYFSYDDFYLFACVVEMETGGEPYEERLAVANVIINRYYSGIWGNNLHGIIYSPQQFTGANTGLLASYLASGPSAGTLQAAYDACAGYNNIGNYMFFCTPGKINQVNSKGGFIMNGRIYFYVL